MPAIKISNLTKVFYPARPMSEWLRRPWDHGQPLVALQDVSVTIEEGEFVCLMGPNGAGKTTLLKILSTLVLPTSGTVRVQGYCVQRQDQAVRAMIGVVPGDMLGFYACLSGRQNLEFFAALYGMAGRHARRRIGEVAQLLELHGIDWPYQAWSTGMKQRLALARALLHDPPILLMDEPTKSLDPIQTLNVQRLILDRLNRQLGKTVVVTTHAPEQARAFGGTLLVLHHGAVRACGSFEQVVAGRDVVAAFSALCP